MVAQAAFGSRGSPERAPATPERGVAWGASEPGGEDAMRRSVIALALAAMLSYPIASAADAGPDEESAGSGEAATPAPAKEPEPAAEAEPAETGEEEAAAAAGEAGGEEEAEAEEGEPGWSSEYATSVKTRALTGLNGLVTAPADPVMATVTPPKAFDESTYLRRPLGFGAGMLQMLYRALTRSVDLRLAIFPELPVVSPVPRYKLVPGFEHEDE